MLSTDKEFKRLHRLWGGLAALCLMLCGATMVNLIVWIVKDDIRMLWVTLSCLAGATLVWLSGHRLGRRLDEVAKKGIGGNDGIQN